MPRRYQGKEVTTTIQAPTKRELGKLIRSTQKYAGRHGMEDVRILERGKDPDGGYRAIVTAHNWNPIKWLRGRPGAPESLSEKRERERGETKSAKRRVQLLEEEMGETGRKLEEWKKKEKKWEEEVEPIEIDMSKAAVTSAKLYEKTERAERQAARARATGASSRIVYDYERLARQSREAAQKAEVEEEGAQKEFEASEQEGIVRGLYEEQKKKLEEEKAREADELLGGRREAEELVRAGTTRAKEYKEELGAEKIRRSLYPSRQERLGKFGKGLMRAGTRVAGGMGKGFARAGVRAARRPLQPRPGIVTPIAPKGMYDISGLRQPGMQLGTMRQTGGLMAPSMLTGAGLGGMRQALMPGGMNMGGAAQLFGGRQAVIEQTALPPAPTGLTPTQQRVYDELVAGTPPDTIPTKLGLKKVTVTNAIRQLNEKGAFKQSQPVSTQAPMTGRINPLMIPTGGVNLRNLLPGMRSR